MKEVGHSSFCCERRDSMGQKIFGNTHNHLQDFLFLLFYIFFSPIPAVGHSGLLDPLKVKQCAITALFHSATTKLPELVLRQK